MGKKRIFLPFLNKANIHQIPKSEEDITINELERKIKSILIENDEMTFFIGDMIDCLCRKSQRTGGRKTQKPNKWFQQSCTMQGINLAYKNHPLSYISTIQQ